jgi:PAS domain S-box-containing protein
MNPSTHTTPSVSGYHLKERLYEGTRTVVYRGLRQADRQPVVIKILQQKYPSFSEILKFRNQYTIAKNLNIPGIVSPYTLEPHGNSYALVMEDFGGISLREWMRATNWATDGTDGGIDKTANGKSRQHPTSNIQNRLADVLAIALQLSDILHDLHQARVIHKDLKPANILIHPETGDVKLIDFSIASLLPKETQDIQNPNVLEGTLTYLAPEQTGRMNRGIDYRSDFYALGVTLFELLTGQVPFQSSDPMELLHCHLTQRPPDVHSLNLAVPPILSEIVLKLMAKNAEDRYQSALGLKHDLLRCQALWEERGTAIWFPLGERDVSDRFLIPEKLYGRDAEVMALLSAFNRVSEGSTELLLVAGFSGIGKTAVVNEVHKPITRQKGYFIKGKFDQFNRNIPFSAFVQAFRDLMGQLLAETDIQLQTWKTEILDAVGENGQVLIEVIPDLERILGAQPPTPDLSGSAAQNRFNMVFQKFIQVFTTPDHPLVIFLDDLQWADSASLQLLQLLMTEIRSGYLLILGAYRDNEVFPAHPLVLTLDTLQKTQATVEWLTLEPLQAGTVNQLVAETLACPEDLSSPLTELVYQKTQGNPFFTTQFLKALHEDGWIQFEVDLGYWQCDLAAVRQLALTEDVVEFMAMQLQKLPQETQTVLKLAACIGNQFDLQTVAIVSECSELEAATVLWKALQEGLILPVSQTYKFFQSHYLDNHCSEITVSYKFLHDRVQQAAYLLIAESEKQTTHYKIGQQLLQKIPECDREERIFEIVNQMNMALELIQAPTIRQELATLNLTAGHKAKQATAYGAAVKYFAIGRHLLPSDSWQTQYNLTLALHVEAAEATYLNAEIDQMEDLAETVLQQAKTALDTVKIYGIRILAYTSQGQLIEAIDTGLTALRQFGIDLSTTPTPEDIERLSQETQRLMENKTPADLLNLPEMTNPQFLAALEILDAIGVPVYLAMPQLSGSVIATQMNLSITYGNSASSALAYANYGLFLCAIVGDFDQGYEFAQLALSLLSKLKAKKIATRVLFVTTTFTVHWKAHAKDTLKLLQDAYSSGWESGNLMDLGYAAYGYGYHAYLVGCELVQLEQDMTAYGKVLEQINQQTQFNYNELYRQTVLNLLGKTANPSTFLDDAEQERALLARYQEASDNTGVWHFLFLKVTLCYLFNEFEKACDYAEQAQHYLSGGKGMLNVAVFYFYASLAQLAILPNQAESVQQQILETITINQEKFRIWATHAPMNHLHKFDLIEAEKRRVLGEKVVAVDAYDRAIAGAQANGYVQEAALANELAAKFYLEWGKGKVAAGYMQEAYYGYARWGAQAKIVDLEHRYPELLCPILQRSDSSLSALNPLESIAAPNSTIHSSSHPSSTSSSVNLALDFAAILKASQALSSKIQLDELLHQLTQLILQHSGGDRCALILPNETGEWQVRAISTPENTELCTEPLTDNPNLPVKLIQYAKNTQEVVVINNLETKLPVIDEYLRQRQPKSLLCLPILNQGNLIGILYLKNRLTSDLFTHDRILILNFLCTQAAISLENARLYTAEQGKTQQLTQLNQKLSLTQFSVDHAANGIFWIHPDASFFYINQTACEMLEYSPEDLITRSVLDIDPTVSHEVWELHRQEVKQKNRLTLESHHQSKSGRIYPVEISVNYLEYAGQEYYVAIVRDISERKQAEESILEKTQALEQALCDLQGTQLQMIQSEKMASLGNLVAGIAHEINNPIGFLNGSISNSKDYVEDLLGHLALYQQHYPNPGIPIEDNAEEINLEFLSEDFPKLLNSMKAATDRIKSISASLRTFSRADTEHKVHANLHDGIDSTLLILKYRLKANEVRPTIQVAREYGELPLIVCFPGQLNQVFMNILANAIDMFDEIAQTLSFQELEANPQQISIQTAIADHQVQIRIRDNGKGMTDEVKAKIFDHLFTTKGVGKGTGLGLAIAKQIVEEKHGGKILVNTREGQGTEFILTLPVCSPS